MTCSTPLVKSVHACPAVVIGLHRGCSSQHSCNKQISTVCVLTYMCVCVLSSCRTTAQGGPGCLVSSQQVYWICIYSDANLVLFNRANTAIW